MSAPGLQGLSPWIIQRVSAVYITLYVLYFAISIYAVDPLASADGWSKWMAYPGNNIATGLLVIALLWHAWIGIRDVVLDYVPHVLTRMLVLTLVIAVLFGSGLWCLRTLFLIVAI